MLDSWVSLFQLCWAKFGRLKSTKTAELKEKLKTQGKTQVFGKTRNVVCRKLVEKILI